MNANGVSSNCISFEIFDAIRNKLNSIPITPLQSAVLALSVACAILSLVPALGAIGSISSRSVALLAASVQGIEAWKKEGHQELILLILRVAFVALGLAGVVTHMPQLVLTALVADVLFQTFEAGRGLYKKDLYKVLTNASFIVSDSLAISSMLTNMGPMMVTAASISAFMMLIFAIKAGYSAYQKTKEEEDERGVYIFTTICYLTLSGTGAAGAVASAKA